MPRSLAGLLLFATLVGIVVLSASSSALPALASQPTPTPAVLIPNPLDPIIDNGTLVQLGINPEGHLNVGGGTVSMPDGLTTSVGLRYMPTNGESTAPGCLCEGWGVAAANGSFTGYANIATDGVVGLTAEAGTGSYGTGQLKAESVATSFRSITTTPAGPDRVRVTHDYHPSTSPNLYRVDVTIENIGSNAIADLRYRRVMDWDIAPFTFNEWVEIHVGTATNVLRATTDGFHTANPLGITPPGAGAPPTTLVSGSPDYFGGPDDQGALFDFSFGSLAVGATRTFKTYYGAAETRTEALAALGSVGAEVYSFGIPSNVAGGAATTGPHIFIFAFGDVGGAPVGPTPTPTTTPTPTRTATSVPQQRPNVGGAAGAVGAAAASQARDNRATAQPGAATSVAGQQIAPPRTGTGITPPNTGDAGLERGQGSPAMLASVLLGFGVAGGAALKRRRT